MAQAKLPTRFGIFDMAIFQSDDEQKEHIALIKGNLQDPQGTLVRIHSECLTGDTLYSKRCDCGEQLQKTFKMINKAKTGMIIYLRQEGRGIGLLNKIKAYQLQDKGLDTIEANEQLGLPADMRRYDIALEIFHHFKIKKIRLLTNNPEKMHELEPDIQIVKRVPLEVKPNSVNRKYLRTKKQRFGHILKNV